MSIAFAILGGAAVAQSTPPTTEQYLNALGTCAAHQNITLSGDMLGSIKSFFEGSRTQGKITLQNAPDFLKLFPETERRAAYELYVSCVVKILGLPDNTVVSRPKLAESCPVSFKQCRSDYRVSAAAGLATCQRYIECDSDSALAFSFLGRAQRQLGQLAAAEKSFEAQMLLGQKVNDDSVVAHAYHDLAGLYAARGAYAYAESLLRLSLKINLERSHQAALGANYWRLGDVYYQQGNMAAAEEHYKTAIKVATPFDDRSAQAHAHFGLARVQLRLGDQPSSCTHLNSARALLSEGRQAKNLRDVERFITKYKC